MTLRQRLLPYALLAPGLIWLILFFLIPMYFMGELSMKTGSLEQGYQLTWAFENYTSTISDYSTQFLRAFLTFIRRNPQLYALMQTEQALAANDAVRAAERAAFAVFQSSFEGDDRVPPERVEEVSLTIWVLGRGIASAVLMQGDDDPGAAGRLVAKVISGFGFLLSPRFAD